MSQTKRASCVCGKVELAVDIDVQQGLRRCNCSACTKRGWLSAAVPNEALRVTAGAEHVVVGEASPWWTGRRCGSCQVVLFGTVEAPEAGGPRTILNVRLLDDVSLHGAPVVWLDGRGDTWAPYATEPHHEPEPGRRAAARADGAAQER